MIARESNERAREHRGTATRARLASLHGKPKPTGAEVRALEVTAAMFKAPGVAGAGGSARSSVAVL